MKYAEYRLIMDIPKLLPRPGPSEPGCSFRMEEEEEEEKEDKGRGGGFRLKNPADFEEIERLVRGGGSAPFREL
ncbi:hypothetical protein E2C01_057764 [Portunus trituberculatus]|uniref:Uncharacterized protein n=1 Tax=Portunus trituberculatus TaxID=210409 RepID=A0A5B7H0W1_PORTR|nr:hypothetical protein [Portunus trituberculatus]